MEWDWKNEVVLITGASSGLGEALALEVAQKGASVVLVARNEARLAAVQAMVEECGGRASVFIHDFEDIYGVEELFLRIKDTLSRPISILINNAGYNAVGFVENTPLEIYEQNYKVNTLSPIACIQNVLPEMIERRHGGIINIMSAAMYHSFPAMSSYCASKFALKAIHESLHTEVEGYNIQTLDVEPGGFKSRYWQNLDMGKRLKDYQYPPHARGRDVTEVAKIIIKALAKGKSKVRLGGYKDIIGEHLNYWAPRLVDRLLVWRNKQLLQNRPHD